MIYTEQIMEQITLDWGLQRRSYTVSELTAEMRSVLGQFADIWVSGEISGAKLPPADITISP